MVEFAPARPAQPADLDELMRLATGMFTDMNGQPPGTDWQHHARDALQRRIGHDLLVYVIEHPDHKPPAPPAPPAPPGHPEDPDGQPVLAAFASGAITQRLPSVRNLDGRVGYIQWVATDPTWRRHGLARAATTALLDAFDHHGIAMNELHTSPDARDLYTTLGFQLAPHPSMRRYPTPSPSPPGPN